MAIQAYEKAISLQRKLGLKADLANSLKNLGDLYFELHSEVKRAEVCYQQALEIYQAIGDRLGEANVLQEFGKLQENPEQQLDYFHQAQKLYTQIADIYSQSRNLLFIADVQLNMGQPDSAIDSLNKAAELAAAIGYEPLQRKAQEKIAAIHSTVG